MLQTLRYPSRFGELITCGDGKKRVLYPGILIASLDGEEACYYCGCRAALANYPCLRCIVHFDDLDDLSLRSEPRTTASMRSVFDASRCSRSLAERVRILSSYGLNYVKVRSTTRFFKVCNMNSIAVECAMETR
jgi:hypothetical protein